jgi:uncharacterized membrane protein YidH (DUF202 family)
MRISCTLAALRWRAYSGDMNRTFLIVVGVIILAIGGVFAGQGANIIPGSSMTGDPTWLYIGIAMAIVGVIIIVVGARRGGAKPRE